MPPLLASRLRLWPRAAVLALVAAGAAGCSADVSRFESNPFANTLAANPTPPSDVTSAVPNAAVAGQQLPPPQPMATSPGARPSPAPPYQPVPLASRPAAPPRVASAPASAPPRIASGTHEVGPGETLSSLGRLYGKSRSQIASANQLSPDSRLRLGQRLVIPGTTQAQINAATRRTSVAAAVKHAPQPAQQAPAARQPAQAQPAPQQLAAKEPTVSANLASPAAENPVDEKDANGGALSFRWPVRGRVISGFGNKTGGQQNDGINISVPEGTSVKAAEDGVVAYAGNELKGYGNLVLVRHSGGYVTAYAHANEVLVKRGDRVKRGQIIARAGKSGSVTAPQLHFEIRKGSSPIDPMQFLRGAHAGM
jgi:murein DD-endopeptidase MepM/ murein hydrolase activator NlpD